MTDPRYWLALVRAPGLGLATCRHLLDAFRSPQAIFEAGPRDLARHELPQVSLDWLASRDWEGVEQDLRWLEQPANHLVTLADPGYPAKLKEIASAPIALFVHGDPEVLGTFQLAIVGSRNPTPTGKDTAFEFARHLASAGLTITSGLALGIDGAAHSGALAAGGLTVAVAGTGLDRVYPARHRDLAHAIAESGALVSEFPTGTPPLPEHFPRRNRLISGLSIGTLVVEAAVRSGSLSTAYHALEQGREVFAIPGSIHNPLAKGCHHLIRQGAKLVETSEDILVELGPLVGTAQPAEAAAPDQASAQNAHELDEDYHMLLAVLDYDPTPIDVLVERSGLTPEAVSSMLLVLELHGLVTSSTGGRYARVTKRV